MGPEGSAAASTSSSSPAASVKRSRDPEDEVYVDNLHSHKRYLSEVEFRSIFQFVELLSLSASLITNSQFSKNIRVSAV